MFAEETAQDLICDFKMMLMSRSPFIGTLACFTYYQPTSTVKWAHNDGLTVKYNPEALLGLTKKEVNWTIARQILHCMLRHASRGRLYERRLWAIACSLYVNDCILNDFSIRGPKGAWASRPAHDLTWPEVTRQCESAEDVYAALLQMPREEVDGRTDDFESELDDPAPNESEADLDERWKNAANNAANKHNSTPNAGDIPLGLARALDQLNDPQIPWQQMLSNYVIRSADDFDGYDRRMIGRGEYIDYLDGQALRVYVCGDTSGSVGQAELTMFFSELKGILSSYSTVRAQVYYCDYELYGPYEVESINEVPEPKGGGGTTFDLFFNAVTADENTGGGPKIAVYLTDGHASYPADPGYDVLWVLTPDSIEPSRIPFGQVCKLN